MLRPIGSLFLVLLLLSGCSVTPESPPQVIPEAAVKKPKPMMITVSAVGDMMLGTNFPTNRLPPDDGKNLLASVEPVLKKADITFGNLEGSLLEQGKPRKQCKKAGRCYLFRSPPHYVHLFKKAGFDVVSLANNHARDFGGDGVRETMTHLDKVGILHSGQQGDIASWKVKGVKVALVAFAPFIGSYDLLNHEAAKTIVKKLAASHDIVIVSMHAGAEGLDALMVPFKKEVFYGENRGDVAKFSRDVIDAGADLVIGHGPHVPRGVEIYKHRLVAYSLGNFCTYQGMSVVGHKGLAPILNVTLNKQGKFVTGQIISARQVRPTGPVLDKSHEAAILMGKLSETNFPGSPLKILPSGHIVVNEVVPVAAKK